VTEFTATRKYHQHSSLPKVCPELGTFNRSDLVFTPLSEVRIIVSNRILVFTQSLPTVFHVKISNYNLLVQCPEITEHKEFASRLLQIPKRRELYVRLHLDSSAKLKHDPIGRNANLENNPVDRIQYSEIPVT
jgi:hypothetical protein